MLFMDPQGIAAAASPCPPGYSPAQGSAGSPAESDISTNKSLPSASLASHPLPFTAPVVPQRPPQIVHHSCLNLSVYSDVKACRARIRNAFSHWMFPLILGSFLLILLLIEVVGLWMLLG